MGILIDAILWKYDIQKNGEFAIQIRITRYKDVKYISTGFSSSNDHWEPKTALPSPNHPKFKAIVKKINALTDQIEFEIKLAEKNGELDTLTLAELKNRVVKKQDAPGRKKILEFYDEIIKELEDAGRTGYADLFISGKGMVQKLLSGEDKTFAAFTEKDFKNYEAFINNLKAETTKSIYLRTFYRLWNWAIERKHCPEKHHPKFYIKHKPYKKIKTIKRAIPFDCIKEIEGLCFECESRLFRSKQYFIFSYYSRGINFNDLAKLKHNENIKRGYLSYKRSKNKRLYDFQLHPKALEVLEIFRTYPMQSDAGYVFPILTSLHDTPRRITTRIESALRDFNEDLEVFGVMIGSPKRITSYVIRHSFATNLRDKKVDIAIIKEALGHETEEQTNTYLEEMNDAIIAKSIEGALQ